jgi:beta-glucanase (GH16 family)
MRTKNKGDWKYGRFDIKAKLPYGQGIWPAIWMLPTEWKYGGWAASGEVDIVELLGHEPNRVYGTLHYGGEWPNNVKSGSSFSLEYGTFSMDFHVFTLEWEPGEFRWYVDGTHYLTRNEWHSENGQYPAPFDQYFHLLLNVAVGGNWPGYPDNTTVFPQQMKVDYVRVYKKDE